jgi:UDP-N-acetyl-D-glucosamine dehydrogenase
MSFIAGSSEMVAAVLRRGQLVCLESTTYPGTTRGECLPILERSGLRCGSDFFLAYSPEREDPGRRDHDTATIPKLVGGVDAVSTGLAAELYGAACKKVVPTASAEIAEAAKLLENIYRAVNIALVNELKPVLTSMGIDIWQVIEAASTKPFGFQPFHPGPGLGGHCIPVDPFYLTWKAKEFGHHTRFIELAGEINSSMPQYVVDRVVEGLNRDGRAVRGARLLLCGIAYKPDVDDIRETPAAEILRLLQDLGGDVAYHDPHVARFPRMRKYGGKDFDLESVALTAAGLREYDCVVVVTHHRAIDWGLVAREARLIVDTRNVMASFPNARAKTVQA